MLDSTYHVFTFKHIYKNRFLSHSSLWDFLRLGCLPRLWPVFSWKGILLWNGSDSARLPCIRHKMKVFDPFGSFVSH